MEKQFFKAFFSNAILVFCLSSAGSIAVHADQSIVGTWIGESTFPEFGIVLKDVSTYSKEKVMTATNQNGATGHGIWRKVGKNKYETKLVGIVEPGDPIGLPVGAIATFRLLGTFDKRTGSSTGSGTLTYTFGENNDVLFETQVTTISRRITFDD
jgi:hypothetical protein